MDKPDEISEENLKAWKEAALHEQTTYPFQDYILWRRDGIVCLITEIERLRAERDRLAALVECAAGFDLEEGDTRISFQSNGWTVETEDDDRVRMLSIETQWEEYGSGEWMNSHFLFPTREAAFNAFEAARAKETAK